MGASRDLIRRVNELPSEELMELSEILDFLSEKAKKPRSQEELLVNADLVAVMGDALRRDLEPISIRAKTMLKHLQAGQLNNRKLSHLAMAIVELSKKCDKTIKGLEGLATEGRVGARRCRCDITDLWNGKGCQCGGI